MQNCAKWKKYWFYTFWSKNTHINGCKIVHKCTIVKITVHICTVTVACVFNILLFFLSPPHSLFFSLVWLSTSFEFPFFPNDYNNSAIKKKKNRKTPTQHNPTITTATYTQRKTHSKSKPKSIKTKSNGKPIWKIQHKPTWKTQWKSIRSAVGSTLLRSAAASALLPSLDPTQMELDWHGFVLKWSFLVCLWSFLACLVFRWRKGQKKKTWLVKKDGRKKKKNENSPCKRERE